jgi:ribonuclease-3
MDNPHNQKITQEFIEKVINKYIDKSQTNVSSKKVPLPTPSNDPEQGSGLVPYRLSTESVKVHINNLELYQRAMTHESYYIAVMTQIAQNETTFTDGDGNRPCSGDLRGTSKPAHIYIDYIPPESSERLEFLGDHILKAVIGNYIYSRFPEEREGFLTKLKIKIEKTAMLHQFGLTLGFKDYILLSSQVEEQTVLGENRGRCTPSYYENAFEAFIGAMMLDLGYDIVSRFVKGVIEKVIDFSELIAFNDNYKDSIQRYYQSIKFQTPTYKNITEEGPLYRRIFTRSIWIDTEHLEKLSDQQKLSIKEYTKTVISGFQVRNGSIFLKLMELVSQGNWLVGIGMGKKVINAEQEAAKEGLVTLGLPLDF